MSAFDVARFFNPQSGLVEGTPWGAPACGGPAEEAYQPQFGGGVVNDVEVGEINSDLALGRRVNPFPEEFDEVRAGEPLAFPPSRAG